MKSERESIKVVVGERETLRLVDSERDVFSCRGQPGRMIRTGREDRVRGKER